MNYSFDYLISPVSRERFFEEYFEKKHLKISSDNQSKFDHILKEQDIDTLLSSQRVTLPNTRMAHKDVTLEAKDLVLEGTNVLDISKVIEKYSEGATLILSHLQERIASLKKLCDSLTNDFGQRFQTNIYYTPGNTSQGFNIHHDTHDVFILQVCGQKKWKIYESPIELAIKDQTFIPNEHIPGKIIEELILNPGDLLYIPRGLMHDAQTLSDKSIHITIGFMGYTWQDILVDQLNILSQKHIALRKGLRPNYWEDANKYEDCFEEITKIFESPSFVKNALRQMYVKSINRYASAYNNPMKLAQSIDKISGSTIIKKRRYGNFILENESPNTLLITLFNKELRLPLDFEPVLNYIQNKDSFLVKELPLLDGESQIELTQTLLKNGLLEIEYSA